MFTIVKNSSKKFMRSNEWLTRPTGLLSQSMIRSVPQNNHSIDSSFHQLFNNSFTHLIFARQIKTKVHSTHRVTSLTRRITDSHIASRQIPQTLRYKFVPEKRGSFSKNIPSIQFPAIQSGQIEKMHIDAMIKFVETKFKIKTKPK